MKKIITTIVIFLSLLTVSIYASNNVLKNNNNIIVNKNEQIMLDSPLFTKKETYEKHNQKPVDMANDGFILACSNSSSEMYYNKKTAAIRVKDIKSGYVWATDLLNIDEYKHLNNVNRKLAQSGFEVTYLDSKGQASTISKYARDNSSTIIRSRVSGKTINFDVEFVKLKLKFSYSVTLNHKGINVKLDHKSIKEDGDYYFSNIRFFPYFGATYKSQTPGYMFIPSGNGALIRFDNKIAIDRVYQEKYYGVDANLTQNEERDPLSLPIFGITHGVNQHAMLAEIESGAEIASLTFEPSSIKTNFNRLYNTFSVRDTYIITIPGTDTTVTMIPENVYNTDLSINYSFLENEDANYIGMAKCYREKLIKNNVLNKNNNTGTNKVNIDVLGGETKPGIISNKFLKMTTTDDIVNINNNLKSNFDNDILYTLRGFNKGGLSRHNYNNYKFTNKLGSLRDLEGLEYYMYYNPVETYSNKPKANRQTLVNLSKSQFQVVIDNGKYKFYNSVKYVEQGLNDALNYYDNVYLDGVTSKLYGDGKEELSRTDVYNKYDGLINRKIPMVRPNAYLLKNTSNYLNMPLYHSKLRFVTDSVPFLQILLRGYIDYYSPYLNFSTNQEIDLLKAIEYGSNLSYLISNEESYELSSTLSSHLFATHFNSNKDLIINQVKKASEALCLVKGREIVDRVVLGVGLVKVTYESNIDIYINYNSNDVNVGDIVIPKMGYKVVR